MIELDLPKHSLMGGWFMNGKICDDIIKSYKDNSIRAKEGKVYDDQQNSIVEKKTKESFDLHFEASMLFSPYREYLDELQKALNLYHDKYAMLSEIQRFTIKEFIYIQKYPPGGGFKKWHFEEPGHLKRCLVFMTFLNDLTDEGGTEFLYQDIKIKPQKGLTVIWPSYWTHTHRGVISKTQEKYIVTGWYSNF